MRYFQTSVETNPKWHNILIQTIQHLYIYIYIYIYIYKVKVEDLDGTMIFVLKEAAADSFREKGMNPFLLVPAIDR